MTKFCRSLATGTGDGSSWVNAATTFSGLCNVMFDYETGFVADDHNEIGASFSNGPPGRANRINYIICADHTVTNPGPGDWKTTAVIATNDTGNTNITGNGYFYGLNIRVNVGQTNNYAILFLGENGFGGTQFQRWENCTFALMSTGTNGSIQVSGNPPWRSVKLEWFNCSVYFSDPSHGIGSNSSTDFWWGNSIALMSGSVVPNAIFNTNNTGQGGLIVDCEGVDFSAITTQLQGVNNGGPTFMHFKNCLLAPGVVISNPANLPANHTWLTNCDSGGTNYRQEKWDLTGIQMIDTTVVRTGGASDGVTPISWKIGTNYGTSFGQPFTTFQIDQWNTTTGANVPIYVRGICASGINNYFSAPTNIDIWIEAQYMGSAGSPRASFKTSAAANFMATPVTLTADTSAWDSKAPARVNNTAYVLGNVVKTASNPGRVFFCTHAGTSGTSEPAGANGYNTAVDGGIVYDGGATFQTGWRFVMTLTLTSPTPQLVGSVFVVAKVGSLNQAQNIWLDPQINSS